MAPAIQNQTTSLALKDAVGENVPLAVQVIGVVQPDSFEFLSLRKRRSDAYRLGVFFCQLRAHRIGIRCLAECALDDLEAASSLRRLTLPEGRRDVRPEVVLELKSTQKMVIEHFHDCDHDLATTNMLGGISSTHGPASGQQQLTPA